MKRKQSIYYPNSERTITLENAIKRIYTDKKQPLRINLEKIIELRNTSTHFITEDYETIYAPFFQSCVLNFCEQIKRFHKIDITDFVPQNFLTLSVSMNILTNEQIRGKYSKEMAERLITNKNEMEFLINNNSSNDLSIQIRHEFVQIKDKKAADFTYAISPNAGTNAKIITRLQDPNDKYKLTRKIVIDSINKQLTAKNIPFDYQTTKGENVFNEYTLNLIMKFYDLNTKEKYCFKFGSTRRYSQQLVEFIITEIKNNSNIVDKIIANKKR